MALKRKVKVQPDRAKIRREFLALKPLRNPDIESEEAEGRAVLVITPPNTASTKILGFFLPLSPEERKKRVVLDAVGTDVWNLCDGKHSIADISKALQKTYKLQAQEAELSLRQFFQTLGKRGYVGFVQQNASKPKAKG